MERSAQGRGEKIVSLAGRVYLAVELLGLPLIFHDGFFDVTEAKTLWFVIPTLFFVAARLLCALQFAPEGRRFSPPKKPEELAALALCFFSLLASLSSGAFRTSFTGETGRWQGAGMLWLYAAVFFAFSGVRLQRRDVLWPLAGGLFLSGVLAVCNHLGWDVLGLVGRLGDFDKGRYISTLGNINFAGAYLSLALPAAVAFMLRGEKRLERAVLAPVCAVGLCAALAVRSDCALLGLGAAGLALPFFLPRRADVLGRCWLLWPAAVLLSQLYRLAAGLAGAEFSSLASLLLRPALSLPAALAGAALYLLTRRGGEGRLRRVLRGYGLGLLLCAVLGAGALVALNTVFAQVDLGNWGEWLRFSDNWGTDRVLVWKYCLSVYGDFSPWEKLLGGGCGVLPAVDRVRRVFKDAILDAAHCEYLQILLNWGALGLTAYVLWLCCAGRRAFRRGERTAMALCVGLIGYAAQAAVNIAQAPGIMLFFVLLAVQRADFSGESP